MKRNICTVVLFSTAVLVVAVVSKSQTPPLPPAPAVDRVGFPTGYRENFHLLYTFDRPDNRQVRIVYANDNAFSVKNGMQGAYPYGSVIVMETWRTLQDSSANPLLDADGRYQKDTLNAIFVMRKEKGFGVDYKQNQTGEWEYVAYNPDTVTYNTTPRNSFNCAICHQQAAAGKDWVFRASLHFNGGSGAVAAGVIKGYKFVPGVIFAKVGDRVTIYNDDVVDQTLADDTVGNFVTEHIRGGNSITFRFDHAGELNFHCTLHQNMKGKIVVE